MLQRSIKQVLIILAVSMFAVAGAPAQRGDGGRAGRENSVKKGTPVVAGIIIQKEGWDSCVFWDMETGSCLDGGGSTSGTEYTCTGVCNINCNSKGLVGTQCQFWGWHAFDGSCGYEGQAVFHAHPAKQK